MRECDCYRDREFVLTSMTDLMPDVDMQERWEHPSKLIGQPIDYINSVAIGESSKPQYNIV